MELNTSQVILEIINFLILLWLLKLLLFKPVLNALQQRQQAIADKLQSAESREAKAQALEAQYSAQLKALENEATAQRKQLADELALCKSDALKKIQQAVDAETEVLMVQQRKALCDEKQSLEETAIKQSLTFMRAIFARFATRETSAKMIDEFLTNPTADLQSACLQSKSALVHSAYPLTEAQQQQFAKLCTTKALQFSVVPELLAGVELILDTTVWRANLRDECDYFATITNRTR